MQFTHTAYTPEQPPSAAVLLRSICERHRVTRDMLRSSSRYQTPVHIRHFAMWMLHRYGCSYSAIGRMLNRNHASVIHGCRLADAAQDEPGLLGLEVRRVLGLGG